MAEKPSLSSLRVAAVYLVFGVAWILLSDYVVAQLAGDVSAVFRVQVVKGWLFVGGSAALIFWLVRRERDRWERTTRELEESNRLLDAVVEGTNDAIYAKDREGRYLMTNSAAADLTGRSQDEMVGSTDDELFDPETAGRIRRDDRRVMEAGTRLSRTEELELASGEERVFHTSKAPLQDGDEIVGVIGISRDVTEKQGYERELERRTIRDELTGLANRTLFRDRLGHALDAAARHEEDVAVLFTDLDRFKVVNDSLGHPAGDRLLEKAARRVRRCFRDEDTVARLGGDEFAVILARVGLADEVEEAARRLVAAFEEPFRLDGQEVHQPVSVGIAVSSKEGAHPDDLTRFSDIAMYRAKSEEGSTYRFFDPEIDGAAGERLQRENELREGIRSEQFVLHYQPVVDLATGRIVGGEALVRWEHPERGLLAPNEFISLAEETGLIVPLGAWVIRAAFREARRWTLPSGPGKSLEVGINVSARQLQEPDATERIIDALASSGIAPERVVLEITESVAVGNRVAIRELRDHGLRVAVDDLGTGYASLEYLTRLEVDIMKVDQLFTAGIGEDPRDEAIVEAAEHIAHRLGMTLVAEGIETEAQLHRLRKLGYDHGQGYLFAKPRPAHEFEQLLAEDPTWAATAG